MSKGMPRGSNIYTRDDDEEQLRNYWRRWNNLMSRPEVAV
jgi:hypothetical protein